jgi:hypothetical protein
MSPLGLLLAVVGAGLVWSRGGPAVRLAAVRVVLVALVFVPSPRVASYQPWAMRRYLPIVLPGLALAAGTALGMLFASRARVGQLGAVALVAIVLGLQIRPVLAVRDAGYYGDSLTGVERVAAHIPSDALVVVDGGFADLQVQVPLWLVFGRETVMVNGSTALWREVLTRLVASGRPVYWIQNQLAPVPEADGLVFTAVALGKDGDLAIRLPDSPLDVPPGFVSRRWAPLSLYGVRGGGALGAVAGAFPSPTCSFSLGSKIVRASQSGWVMTIAVNVTV